MIGWHDTGRTALRYDLTGEGETLVLVHEMGGTLESWDFVLPDLAPGRPLHPETWAHLLETSGFEGVQVIAGGTTRVFEPVPGDDEVAAAINRNFERLEQLLAGATSAAIVGRREGR